MQSKSAHKEWRNDVFQLYMPSRLIVYLLPMRKFNRFIIALACLIAIPAAHAASQPESPVSAYHAQLKEILNQEGAVRNENRHSEALSLIENAIKLVSEKEGPGSTTITKLQNSRAINLYYLKRYPEAELSFRKAFAYHRNAEGFDGQNAKTIFASLISTLEKQDKKSDIQVLLTEKLSALETRFGEKFAKLYPLRQQLALNLQQQGKLTDAENLLYKNWTESRTKFGESDAKTINAIVALAGNLRTQKRSSEAYELYSIAYGFANAQFGAIDTKTNTIFDALYSSHLGEKDYAIFEKTLRTRTALLSDAFMQGKPEAIKALYRLAVNLEEQKKTQEAIKLYGQTLAASNEFNGISAPQTKSAIFRLNSLFKDQGMNAQAAEVLANQIGLFEQENRRNDPALPDLLMPLSSVLEANRNFLDAEKSLNRAIQILELNGGQSPQKLFAAKRRLANIYISQNRMADAEEYLLANVAATAANSSQNVELSKLADFYLKQGRSEAAAKIYQRIYKQNVDELGENSIFTIEARHRLAASLSDLGSYAEANSHLREVVSFYEKRPNSQSVLYRDSLNSLGYNLVAQGNFSDAESVIRRAIAAGKESPDTSDFMSLTQLQNLAATVASLKRYDEADQLYSQALALHKSIFGIDDPFRAQLLENIGVNLLNHPDRRHEAVTFAREAFLAKGAISNIRAPNIKSNFGKAEESLFALLSEAAAEASFKFPNKMTEYQEDAFIAGQGLNQNSASQAIIRTVAKNLAQSKGSNIANMVQKQEQLGARWDEVNTEVRNQITQPGSSADREAKLKNLFAERTSLTKERETVSALLEKQFPEYSALLNTGQLDLKSVQNLLKPDEAILFVSPTLNFTQVFAVTDKEVHWSRPSAGSQIINKIVQRLLWDVGADVSVSDTDSVKWSEEGEGAYPFDRTSAHQIYQILLGDVVKQLEGKKHLFVVAGGSLSNLPFGVLVTEPPTGLDGRPEDLRNTKWMADKFALIQLPSIKSFYFLRKFEKKPDQKIGRLFLGFGDPILGGTAQNRGSDSTRKRSSGSQSTSNNGNNAGDGIANVRQISKMARLPGTAIELEAMRSALGAPMSNVVTGDTATERNLRATDLSNVKILALATHGVLAGEIEGVSEPGLIFTPPTKPDNQDDGILTASEIAGLNLSADWVILSACNTAAGDGSEGAPGLSGLARAFFYAGAKNLLASYWPVRDDVAAKITVRTIEIANDNQKLSRAEAFQAAMREIRNDTSADSDNDTWAHPNAWAPFTLIGDGAK